MSAAVLHPALLHPAPQNPAPQNPASLRPTIDTVGWDRMRAMVDRSRDAVARRLLHPDERIEAADLDRDGFALFAGGRLVVKEAWVKAVGRRPDGWQFADACFRPGPSAPSVHGSWSDLCTDLELEPVETGTVSGDGPSTAPAACYGIRGGHLIGVVLS